ncbi:P-loop containing nucleoside triphosphate hydrolase protein [Blyttiomyces helicus]|uniref:P-loop containing nucleoside triphosphate hydrolase protein n=1 Tax=Blyttiomyces helicus TaxID=388810 RepID=A0A4P9WKR0_9FUNG|nr:P-loop containing nucleoside triphosphate hydrolase protein [Blyttiomyces helicus]|eukprot:RKO93404.1 P-loop containing nucleoside triphosphate hydrolase protein [Blyttiomyces helicus]
MSMERVTPAILGVSSIDDYDGPGEDYVRKWIAALKMELKEAIKEFNFICSRNPDSVKVLELRNVHSTTQGYTATLDIIRTVREQLEGQEQLPKNLSIPVPGELTYALLRHDRGWAYLTYIDGAERAAGNEVEKLLRQYPILVSVKFYSMDGDYRMVFVPFESLSLRQFDRIDRSLRNVFLLSGHLVDGPSEYLPLSSQSTKLNEGQLAILNNLRSPVDFVQGPPGTGKSTFITELVRLRIPEHQRVLICTTTNKAIDSICEKLVAIGFVAIGFIDCIVAYGNEARMGSTTKRCLLEHRVDAHPVAVAFNKAANLVVSAQEDADRLITLDHARRELPRAKASRDGFEREGRSTEDIDETIRAYEKVVTRWRHVDLPKRWQQCLSNVPQALEHLEKFFAGQALYSQPTTRTGAGNLLNQFKAAPEMTIEAFPMESLRSVVGKLQTSGVRKVVQMHVLETCRFVVTTAASAVRLPDRIGDAVANSAPAASDPPSVASLTQYLASLNLDDGSPPSAQPNSALWKFEHVILDEGGAMLELIGTVVHGARSLVIVGDPLQLPPFTKLRDARGGDPSRNRLSLQYRMHPHIAEIVSTVLYEGELRIATATARARQRDYPVRVLVPLDGYEEERRKSTANLAEAKLIAEFVEEERRHYTATINIITPYKGQVKAILDALENKNLSLDENLLDVSTVDSMQGREADIVFFSCVRTERAGFLTDERRLNVAISRAKECVRT